MSSFAEIMVKNQMLVFFRSVYKQLDGENYSDIVPCCHHGLIDISIAYRRVFTKIDFNKVSCGETICCH